MSEKYYWLKIHEHFFNDEKILYLESMENGEKYILFWQKMLLRCLKNRHEEDQEYGFLRFSKKLPYTPELLSKLTRTDIDTVRVAIKYFQDLDMLEILEDGTLYIEEVNKLIGKESSSADRVRKHREKKELLKLSKKEPKTNALRQRQFQAKKYCETKQHIPYIEDYINNKRYNGNYYIVFKRDKMNCVLCNSITNLCVHHIDGYDEINSENNNENKLIILCRECHRKVHEGLKIPEDILQSIDYYNNEYNVTCNKKLVTCNDNKEETKEKKDEYKEQIKQIIDYLNKKCNKKFTYKNTSSNKHIISRLKEGFTLTDFYTVISNKLKDPYFKQNPNYYNPETLFRPSNFEKYLNENYPEEEKKPPTPELKDDFDWEAGLLGDVS